MVNLLVPMEAPIKRLKSVIARSVATKQSQRIIPAILVFTFLTTTIPCLEPLTTHNSEPTAQLAPESRFAEDADMGKIDDLLNRLKSEVRDDDCEAVFKLAMRLAMRYATSRDEASRASLSKFLFDLAGTLRFHDKYSTQVDPMYYAIARNRFQKLYDFVENEIYPVLLEKFQNDESALDMLEPIEILLEEFDNRHRRARVHIDRNVDLAEQYEKAVSDEVYIKGLLKQYPMPGVRIKVKNSGGFLVSKGVVRLHKASNDHFIIDISGVPDSHREYVLLHEFLHIWHDRQGLTFDYENEDEDIRLYLWLLRDLISDYIVEKEIHNLFGDKYGWVMRKIGDYYLTNYILGEVKTKGIITFMLAITGKVTTHFYPNLKDSELQRFISPEGIQWDNMDETIAVLDKISIRSSPEEFREAVLEMHHLLTGGASIFAGSSIDLLDEAVTKKSIETINASIESILQAVRSSIRKKSEEIGKRQNARDGA